jgi:hypothetical protein
MPGILEAVTAVLKVAQTILGRVWGNRTQQEDSTEKEIARLEATYLEALKGGDTVGANLARQQLVRLLAQVDARRAAQR